VTDSGDQGDETADRSGDDVDQARQDEVRRLLAAAGAEPPRTPPEVAARLDDVLSRLAAERTPAVPRADHLGGPVLPTEVVGADDLVSRRRRRWPQVLVAAAAVSVLGLGVATVLDGRTVQEDAASSDAGGAAAPESALRAAQLPSVRAVSLATDVQRIEDLAVAQPADRRRALQRACVTPHIGAGDEWVRIRYDQEPAVLVLRAPSADRRTAEIFTCESARDPVASTTVRAR
jgi:hypothetical protein